MPREDDWTESMSPPQKLASGKVVALRLGLDHEAWAHAFVGRCQGYMVLVRALCPHMLTISKKKFIYISSKNFFFYLILNIAIISYVSRKITKSNKFLH